MDQPFERKVQNTIKNYDLLSSNSKICVAVSGGKDSLSVLYLLNKWYSNVQALIINPHIGKYSDINISNTQNFCADLGIPLTVISFREEYGGSHCYLKSVLSSKGHNLNSCSICGILRRRLLNREARKLKADVVVTGHNLSDEAEAVLINLFRGSPDLLYRMGPKSSDKRDVKLIPRVKPLYDCTNEETEEYAKSMKFPVKFENCPCVDDAYRYAVRKELAVIAKSNPDVYQYIVNFLKIEIKTNNSIDRTGSYCKKCSEPANDILCKSCKIIKLLE